MILIIEGMFRRGWNWISPQWWVNHVNPRWHRVKVRDVSFAVCFFIYVGARIFVAKDMMDRERGIRVVNDEWWWYVPSCSMLSRESFVQIHGKKVRVVANWREGYAAPLTYALQTFYPQCRRVKSGADERWRNMRTSWQIMRRAGCCVFPALVRTRICARGFN